MANFLRIREKWLTETSTIKCEAIFNEAHTYRFSWKRVWGKDSKGVAAVIMLNPAQPENDGYLQKAAERSLCIIVARGKSADTNKRIASRAKVVPGPLKPYQETHFARPHDH